MNEVNLYPSVLAAHLATKYLHQNGLIIFTGAASVYKQPQPDMIAYALAKTEFIIWQLIQLRKLNN